MRFQVIIEKQALKDIRKIKNSGNRSDLKKVQTILEELELHPEKGTGKPEALKYDLAGFWSRLINKKDRMIYKIVVEPDRTVIIISALGHYQ